jgi:hypothetical protein
VISAMRRSLGNDGLVTPRSQRETVIDSTASFSASCFWVRPAARRAVRKRPPTPALNWAASNRDFLSHSPSPLHSQPLETTYVSG